MLSYKKIKNYPLRCLTQIYLKNSVDPDQLALRSQLIRICTVLHSACKYIILIRILQIDSNCRTVAQLIER